MQSQDPVENCRKAPFVPERHLCQSASPSTSNLSHTDLEWFRQRCAYVMSVGWKAMEAAASAAADSAACSVPGLVAEMEYPVLSVVMSSGLIQHEWSELPSPTWQDRIGACKKECTDFVGNSKACEFEAVVYNDHRGCVQAGS